MNLHQEILNIFQVTSLIMVFITVLFGLRYERIINDIDRDIPNGERAKQRELKKLWSSFYINLLPQLVFTGIISYMILPLTVRIITVSRFHLWNFDFLITAFMVVVIWIWFFFAWALSLSYKILKKIHNKDFHCSNSI